MTPERDVTEVREFLARNPDVVAVDVLVPDGSGILRGKRVPVSHLEEIFVGGCPFPGSIHAFDYTGATIDATGLGFDDGDADRPCRPVRGTLVRTPWLDRPTGQVLLAMEEHDGTPFAAAPRTVLQQVAARLAADGLTPVVAVELEFYLIDRDWGAAGRPRPPAGPVSGVRPTTTQVYALDELVDFDPILSGIHDAGRTQGIPVDTAIIEYGPGQCEINLHHVPDPVLAADHAMLFKRVVRGVAARHGVDATFMAKPYPEHTGSGLHVHISLLDRDGCNVFEDPDRPGAPAGSDRLRHAVGGQLATMAGAMALFAPNANSFRRYQTGSYAPTRPGWGINNRTTAIRIPVGPPGSKRIEHRVAGADANPYLVVAALLAGIHHGLTSQIDPGPPTTGNAYDSGAPPLPTEWTAALDAFERSAVLRGYVNDAFVKTYLAVRRAERDKFHAHVTPLEYDWYLRTT